MRIKAIVTARTQIAPVSSAKCQIKKEFSVFYVRLFPLSIVLLPGVSVCVLQRVLTTLGNGKVIYCLLSSQTLRFSFCCSSIFFLLFIRSHIRLKTFNSSAAVTLRTLHKLNICGGNLIAKWICRYEIGLKLLHIFEEKVLASTVLMCECMGNSHKVTIDQFSLPYVCVCSTFSFHSILRKRFPFARLRKPRTNTFATVRFPFWLNYTEKHVNF